MDVSLLRADRYDSLFVSNVHDMIKTFCRSEKKRSIAVARIVSLLRQRLGSSELKTAHTVVAPTSRRQLTGKAVIMYSVTEWPPFLVDAMDKVGMCEADFGGDKRLFVMYVSEKCAWRGVVAIVTPAEGFFPETEREPRPLNTMPAQSVGRYFCPGGCSAPGCPLMARGETPGKLMACERCRVAQYCSKQCQAADWRAHKPVCGQCASIATLRD